MIRSALPIMHLAEPPARPSPRTPVSPFDFAFVMAAALTIVGGSFFLLNLASAHSTGQESTALKFVSETSAWLPSLAMSIGKYALLLLASAVNSALIVMLVQSLRTMDRKMRHLKPRMLRSKVRSNKARTENVRGKRAHMRREAMAAEAASRQFLLSPVFR